jgi:uroporphyrinogen-III synthase
MSAEAKGLAAVRVLSFESRRAAEMAKLIENYGGEATVVPSMREVPIESNKEAQEFARRLAAGDFQVVIFLTGVGVRDLVRVVASVMPREEFVEQLKRVTVIARGPKPLAALKELGVPVELTVPEPNTWRDLLDSIDKEDISLRGNGVALQEYGETNRELLAGLVDRGAKVMQVPVYKWDLPEDIEPLASAVGKITRGEIDLALFTTSMQIVHLLKVAKELKLEEPLREQLSKIAIGSIGPVTSEELREQGIHVDFEPNHPKMGYLVNEAARQMAMRNSAK